MSASWSRKPSASIPSPSTPSLLQRQPHHQRVGADDPQLRAGSAADLRPGLQQHRHSLARIVLPDEDDPVRSAAGICGRRDQRPVRDQLVFARKPARGRLARRLRHSDPSVDPVDQEAEDRLAGLVPGELARCVERCHDRALSPRERRRTDHRRHRLVQVQDVEALAPQHALHSRDRGRAQDDVRQGAVCGDDHRAPDRDHVRRWPTVAPVPRVQHPGEAPLGVVAHDRPRLDPESRSAWAFSSTCSITAPQYDQEYGTTMPTFTRSPLAARTRTV